MALPVGDQLAYVLMYHASVNGGGDLFSSTLIALRVAGILAGIFDSMEMATIVSGVSN